MVLTRFPTCACAPRSRGGAQREPEPRWPRDELFTPTRLAPAPDGESALTDGWRMVEEARHGL
jgi:hypothetical protein